MMDLAILQAEKAKQHAEVPVGAVIVHCETGKVISTAYNQMMLRKDPTAHAEMLAIRKACQKLGTQRLTFCDIYVTLEPCPMCAQALSFSRIRKIFFGAYDPKGGGIQHGPHVFQASSAFHKPEIIGGIKEKKCQGILKDFFRFLR